jgi:hypothetical protein
VQVTYNPGLATYRVHIVGPNPVVTELKPLGPPPKPVRAKPRTKAKAAAVRGTPRADTSGAKAEIVSALQPAYIVCQRGAGDDASPTCAKTVMGE